MRDTNISIVNSEFFAGYTYTGREWDRETGMFYLRFRYYDPMEGRFISKDPSGLTGGINLYAYVDNNPLNYTDPDGMNPRAIIEALKLARKILPILREQLKRAYKTCKDIKCEINYHLAHHKFGNLGKRPHIEVRCWIKGVPGSDLRVQIPIPDIDEVPIL